MRTVCILFLVVSTGTGGEISLTHAMKRVGEVQRFSLAGILHFVGRCSRQTWLWGSVALLAVSFYGFLTMLSWYPVSFVVPATSLAYVAGPFAAKFILGERLSATRWAGISLITLGVALAWVNHLPALPSAATQLALLRDVVFLIAGASLLFYAFNIWAAWRFFAKRDSVGPTVDQTRSYTPPASILKPVRGLDRGAYENFASFCRQDYPEYEILFAVGDEKDPAVAVIQQIIQDFPDRSVRLLVCAGGQGANDKVAKLCRLAQEARYPVLVASDSDVRVAPSYLTSVVKPLADARVGAVTALYRSIEAPSFGAVMDTVGSSAFAGAVLVARSLEGLKFAMGSTIATTQHCLAEIGGFAAVLDRHSDDYELGRRIAEKGYRLELAQEPVDMQFPSESLKAYLRHELRWLVGIRHIRPGGHLGLLLTQGLAWAVAAALLVHSAAAAALWLSAYLFMRLASGYVVGVWGVQDPVLRSRLWLLPLHDFFMFFVWLASFVVNRIEWRGLVFTLDKGRLIPDVASPSRR